MIVDERSYTLRSGVMKDFLDIIRADIIPIQKKILGNLLGYFCTEVGVLNQVVHLWAYEDMADRERRRAELAAYPNWREIGERVRPMIIAQENRLLVATDFGAPLLRPADHAESVSG